MTIHIRNMIDNNQPLNQVGYCNWGHGSELRHLLGSSGFSAEPEGNELMLTQCIIHLRPKRAANASYIHRCD